MDTKYQIEIPDDRYWRRQVKCQDACPVRTDARGYVRAIAVGDDRRAYRILRGPNPLASICGRICGAPCEAACRRGSIDKPISIRALKGFVCDRLGVERTEDDPLMTLEEASAEASERTGAAMDEMRTLLDLSRRSVRDKPLGASVGVIGSGPAGLAAAHDLALMGFSVTVYEMESVPAGMLFLGVPEYRLPRKVIGAEVAAIRALGVSFELPVTVGRDIDLAELRKRHKAVIIAVGAKRSRGLPIKNSNAPGVVGGVEFLRSVALREPLPIGRRVIVIGGGNVAYDVARTVLRQESYDIAVTARMRPGVEEVHLCALEALEEMPATKIEIEEGAEEGIVRHNSIGPHEILVDAGGAFSGVVFKKCLRVYDEEKRFSPVFDDTVLSTLPGDTLLLSVGQQIHFDFIDAERDGVKLTPRGFVECDPEALQSLSAPDIFVAGDCAHGAQLAIHAIASGKRAARGVYRHLTGRALALEASASHQEMDRYEREPDYEKLARVRLGTLSTEERKVSLSRLVEQPLSEAEARREASRCLDCGVNTIFDGERCILCGGCVDVCPMSCLKIVPVGELDGGESLERLLQATEVKDGGDASAIIKDEERCIRCGLCAARCPSGAITMERYRFKEDWRVREAVTA